MGGKRQKYVDSSRAHLRGPSVSRFTGGVIMAANDRFEVPPELRTFAERSVEQARQAFDGFISAAHNAMSAFEGQAETARKGARDVTEKAMTFRRTQLHQAPDGSANRAGARTGREHEQGGEGRRCAERLTSRSRDLAVGT